jgi:zinc transport system substrate-binding protein
MNRQRNLLIFFCSVLCALMLAGCKSETVDPNRMQVYTTLYPLQFFSKQIGGEHVQVTNLVPPGTESHDFEPSARDLQRLTEADLFVYNGAGFEPWAEQIEPQVAKLDASAKIKLLHSGEEAVHKDEHGHEDEHGREATINPHVWLDPQLAKQQAQAIRDGLIKQDPTHSAAYEQNFVRLAAELDKLDKEFAKMVQMAKKKQFVTSHDAFAYLAKRYGLEQIAIAGLSPSDEPSAKELEHVIEQVRDHQLKVIFFETLVNPAVAKTVQREAKVEALVLNPLEGLTKQELDSGENYFTLMRQNKQHLAKALESQ